MSAPNSQSLDEFLITCQNRVELALERLLSKSLPSKKLQDAMRYACLDGGKRIRPVLVYATAQAVNADIETGDAAACAVELIHSYSLVHDDLPAMDDDDLRRGKASVHKAFDDATAILVGDALQALAFKSLSQPRTQLTSQTQIEMVSLLAEAAGAAGMTGGQALDLDASKTDINFSELESLHRLKTGALIKASVLMGALCGSNNAADQIHALETYSENIGLAFQIQDDILDEIGKTEILGKPQGSDRAQDKSTYVSLLGLEEAKATAAKLTNNAIQSLVDFSASATHLRDIARYIINRIH